MLTAAEFKAVVGFVALAIAVDLVAFAVMVVKAL